MKKSRRRQNGDLIRVGNSKGPTQKICLFQPGKSSLVHTIPACNHDLVPSPLHEAFVTFFNMYPDCALRLAEGLGLDLCVPPSQWRSVSGTFGDPGMCGKQFQADVVLAAFLPDVPAEIPTDAAALAALILEPQLRLDTQKGVSWLVYRAGVAARHGPCPAWVLMVTPVPDLSLEFQRAVYPGQSENWPIFVTAGSVTPVLDQVVANAWPAWAALCAALHARGPHAADAAIAALHACSSLPLDQRRCTFELIDHGLRPKDMQRVREVIPEETRKKWELTEYEREGALFIEGREEGRAEGIRASLLQVLATRNVSLTPERHAQIDACSDPDQLQRWFARSLRAASAVDVFAADD